MTFLVRLLLIGWGLAMLAFGGCDLAAPRGRLVEAVPAPGTSVTAPPSEIVLRFSDALANQSTMSAGSTYTLDAAGEPVYGDSNHVQVKGPDPGDRSRKTMRVALPPSARPGLYAVQWRAVALQGNAARY